MTYRPIYQDIEDQRRRCGGVAFAIIVLLVLLQALTCALWLLILAVNFFFSTPEIPPLVNHHTSEPVGRLD